MPEPESQPPQPRPVSTWRWLLMLLPSALALSTLKIMERMEAAGRDDTIALILFAFAVVLCFSLGFLAEKWRHESINSVVWALNYGFMVLTGNVLVLSAYAYFFE